MTIQVDEGVPLHSPESERRLPLCHKLLSSSRLYLLLLKFDEDLAAETKRGRCQKCGGRLDDGRYPRKPRVATGVELPEGYDRRFSYSCANLGCRKRHTPPSARFLGRRVYLGAIVVLATAMQQGATPWRSRRLRELIGVSTQTLARWRAWWTESFAESAHWKAGRAAFSPVVNESEAPLAVIERFAGDEVERLAAMLRWLAPMSTVANAAPDHRQ